MTNWFDILLDPKVLYQILDRQRIAIELEDTELNGFVSDLVSRECLREYKYPNKVMDMSNHVMTHDMLTRIAFEPWNILAFHNTSNSIIRNYPRIMHKLFSLYRNYKPDVNPIITMRGDFINTKGDFRFKTRNSTLVITWYQTYYDQGVSKPINFLSPPISDNPGRVEYLNPVIQMRGGIVTQFTADAVMVIRKSSVEAPLILNLRDFYWTPEQGERAEILSTFWKNPMVGKVIRDNGMEIDLFSNDHFIKDTTDRVIAISEGGVLLDELSPSDRLDLEKEFHEGIYSGVPIRIEPRR